MIKNVSNIILYSDRNKPISQEELWLTEQSTNERFTSHQLYY